MPINAVKPVYNRKTKDYGVEVHRDVHALGSYAGSGYLVYDDPKRVAEEIAAGKLLQSWKPVKVQAVLRHLLSEVAAAG